MNVRVELVHRVERVGRWEMPGPPGRSFEVPGYPGIAWASYDLDDRAPWQLKKRQDAFKRWFREQPIPGALVRA